MTATVAEKCTLACPHCDKPFGDMDQDGNRLETLTGWTNYKYRCKCPWCGWKWLWVPHRETTQHQDAVVG